MMFLHISGEPHTNHVGKDIPARVQRNIACRCRCCLKFNDDEKKLLLDAFNGLGHHEKQNIYLRGCVRTVSDENIRRRPRNANPRTQRHSFTYYVTVGERHCEEVCKASFCALHGIKESRLKRKVLKFTANIGDHRGKHNQHQKLNPEFRDKVRNHIRTFPARESHYSRAKNQTRVYLDSSMSIARMHRLFIQENPDLQGKVLYWLYEDIFNHEFNVSFGYPRSDVCDKCELFTAQIKAAERDGDQVTAQNLKVQHQVHVRKGDAFTTQIQETTESARSTDDGSVHVIAMDYQKNLPLPLTGIGQEYYKRQLWLHHFCIHDTVQEKATMYLYGEHYAAKGPNEVISCLNHYVSTLPASVKELHIFADNCFSQNKNKYMVAFLQHLANAKLRLVYIHYPIPRHSRMPCDRDFGRIEKKKLKRDRVVVPSEWVNMIRTVDTKHPFNIVYVEHPLTDDLTDDGTPVVHVMDYKRAFDQVIKAPLSISLSRGILCKRQRPPSAGKP